MKAIFNGVINNKVQIANCVLIIDDRAVSLEACRALSPSMLRVLEELAKPEADGGVFRIERQGDEVRLFKVGVAEHAVHKAKAALRRV